KRLAGEDVPGEARPDAADARRVVAGEVAQHGPPGEAERTKPMQDRPVEPTRGGKGRVGMQRIGVARRQPVEQCLVVVCTLPVGGVRGTVGQWLGGRRRPTLAAEAADAADEKRDLI